MFIKIIKKIYPLFAPLIVLGIFAIIFKCNNIYPFGTLSVSWCDMDQQTIPLLCEFKDILEGKSDFFLSLENAGGMNFYGVFLFNLSSPFSFLVLLFEKSEIGVAVNIMVVLKLATASLTMAIWLKNAVKNASPFVIVSLSLLYAFSGYAMMYYQILSWLDTYYVFPLLLLGLQKLTEEKSPALYIVSLFACILFHFYIGYAIVIFVCLYGCIFALTHKENCNHFVKNFIISSVISALLSAVIIIPAFLQYLESMRQGSIIASLKYSSFFPPLQTSLPTFFCILAFLPFILNFAKKKEYDYFWILFFLMLIPVIVEPVAKAWQTYNYMSFPTRYGFITISLAILLALRGITSVTEEGEKTENKNKWLKVALSLVAIAFCVAFSRFSYKYFNVNKESITKFSQTLWGDETSLKQLCIYYIIPLIFACLVYLCARYKIMHKIAVNAVIALLCIIECFFGASVYMVKPANEGYYFNKSLELENLIEDNDFYRLKVNAKFLHVNQIGAMGYNSLAHYTSLNRESYMITAKQLGYSSYWMEVNSNGGTVFTDALLRNKYTVYLGESKTADYSTESFYVMENPLIFPTAFIIDKTGENQADISKPRWQIQNDLLTRLTNKNNIYEDYQPVNLSALSVEEQNGCTVVTLDSLYPGYINYTVNVEGTKSLYFDCFNEYTNSLSEPTYESIASVITRKNGVTQNRQYSYPSQSKNGVLYLGTYSNCTVTVEVGVSKSVTAKSFGVFSVDNDLLESAVNELIAGDFTVEKDYLSGKITAPNSESALFTSFAYDEGYKVKINGEKANTFNLNGFLAIELVNGENVVKVDFIPRGFNLSLILSLIGVALFVIYLVFYKKIQNFKKLDKFALYITFALGIIVIFAIYLMPIGVNLSYWLGF